MRLVWMQCGQASQAQASLTAVEVDKSLTRALYGDMQLKPLVPSIPSRSKPTATKTKNKYGFGNAIGSESVLHFTPSAQHNAQPTQGVQNGFVAIGWEIS